MTLRRRLLLATSAAVLFALLVVDVVTFAVVTRSLIDQVDAALERAHPPTEQLANSGDPDSWRIIPEIAPGLFVAIVGPTGDVLFSVPATEPGQAELTPDVGRIDFSTRHQTVPAPDGTEMRIQADALAGGGVLLVGESLHEVNETRDRLLGVLAVASLAAIVTVLAVAWWLIRVGLRPLSAVESAAAAITDDELGDRRVPAADEPTEVGSLARALNAMLDRLELAREERERTLVALQSSETRMRQFVADASHELRTPIAATAAYAELFESGARDRPADLERSMSGIRSETARMSDLVDDLLLLARLDERRPFIMEPVDLTEVVLEAVDAARLLEPDRPFRARVRDVVTVEGDPVRLRQVVDNLLSNVRAHTPKEAACEVTLGLDGDDALLVISDSGPGVSDDQLARLRDRFFRVDNARTRASGGSGLGLAIADAVVAAHGGSMTPSHHEPTGLTITVRLPRHMSDDVIPEVRSETERGRRHGDHG